jgi:hypothetical protein
MTRRGRDIGDRTLAAQTLIEMVRSVGVRGLLGDTAGTIGGLEDFLTFNSISRVSPAPPTPTPPPGTEFDMNDLEGLVVCEIRGFSVGDSIFDARLSLDAAPWRSAGCPCDDPSCEGGGINRCYTEHMPMNATFFQPRGNPADPDTERPNPDLLAMEQLEVLVDTANAAAAASPLAPPPPILPSEVATQREITVLFAQGGTGLIAITVKYEYFITSTHTHLLPGRFYTETYDIGSSYTAADINSVHVCILPYAPNGTHVKDTIDILNEAAKVECNLYLIIQEDPSNNYSAEVNLDEDLPTKARLFSNFNGSGLFIGNIGQSWDDNVTNEFASKSLSDRMFDVTAELYIHRPETGGFAPEDRLTTVTATHLDEGV